MPKTTNEQEKAEIKFEVILDNTRAPESIHWHAEGISGSIEETKAIGISVWDHHQKNTLQIDLWTKHMPIGELKKFYIDTIGGLSESLFNATGDEYMAQEMSALCSRLVEHIKK
ncbi:MAG: gliding motility protein GldC [Cytophagales bacterium]|nr:gliding motility protein GldC [Cytophagales bacterium]